ncbi:sterol desaturase family protein [Dokdonella sp.]|uniref:sterol desaturase family protein n=1 Tax=Dokdonella sp. TaxID=2291710 RepID=UPI003C4B8768
MQWLNELAAQFLDHAKLLVVILLVGLLIERLRPAERAQPVRNIAFNLGYAAFVIIVNIVLLAPLMALMQPIAQKHGLHVPIHFPDGVGWQVLQALAFFFVFDFFYYWFHRAQHTLSVAWPLHKLHHSEESVNVTTTLRHHWLEEPLRVWLILLPIGLLFDQKPITVAWLATAMILFGYFVHLNLRLPLGPLTPLIAGPQWHRLHHSLEPQHTDKNFAAFFPIYDVVFGTYSKPGRNEYPATGLHSRETLNSPILAAFSPFRDWGRMIRSKRQPAVAQGDPGPVDQSADQQREADRKQSVG